MSQYNDQYPPPPAGQYYAPPPRSEHHGGGHHGDGYSTASYASPQAQGAYTYQPPRDEGYRRSPVPTNLQIGQYQQDEYDPRRYSETHASQHHEYHRGSQGGYYAPPPSGYSDRPSSRNSKDRGKSDHHTEKSVGAALLGGAVGAFAGHEVGHGGMSTVIGALAGAYGGHELEKRHEKKKEQKRRESGARDLGYEDDYDTRRRSTSRRRSSRGGGRDSSSSSDDGDKRRRQSHSRY